MSCIGRSAEVLQTVRGCGSRAVAGGDDPGVRGLRSRPVRVVALLVVMLVLSVIDLHLTLTYVSSVGMGEGNPFARWIMDFNSPALLAGWKLGMLAAASMIFVVARGRRSSEIGCWICVAALSFVMYRWLGYIDEAHHITPALDILATAYPKWVQMGE